MEPTPQQIAKWNAFVSRHENRTRKGVQRLIYAAELASKLQALLNDLNVQQTVFDNTDGAEVEAIVDIYNRLDRSISKVQLQTYGLRFTNGDIDIMAPPDTAHEEIMGDEIEGYGALFIIIGVGMIVVGLALKVSEHLESREKVENNKIKERIANLISSAPELADDIQAAIKQFSIDNEPLAKKAGLLDTLLGSGSGIALAIALGLGVVLFAFMKGRK